MRDWYNNPPKPSGPPGPELTWKILLSHWRAIELDLHRFYHVDVEEPGLLKARSWRWLETRILGVIGNEGHLVRALTRGD